MKTKKLIERYWHIFLIGIILISLVAQNTQDTSIILNLHKLKDGYEIENPSNVKINLTIKSENKITGATILDVNQTITVQQENFEAVGEQYE